LTSVKAETNSGAASSGDVGPSETACVSVASDGLRFG
jgi:hypothetical protein